jgi:hypothetical protein
MATQNLLLELPPELLDQIVQFAIRELDRGLSDHYVRNAAGRLIVYGFAHGIYIGFPGERQFEWEYALSGLQALDPENF